MANIKNKLPQEGTGCIGRESLTEPIDSVCPENSGGGNVCHPRIHSDAQSRGGSCYQGVEKVNSATSGFTPMCSNSHADESDETSHNPIVRKEMQVTGDSSRFCSDVEQSDCSLLSSASTASGAPQTRKRRGSRITTRQAKKPAVDDTMAPPATRTRKNLPSVEDFQEELRAQPTELISAKINEAIQTVEKIADSSRNFKGSNVHSLRIAMRSVQAAAIELADRVSVSEVERLKKENEDLRSHIAAMESKLIKLSQEVDKLQQGASANSQNSEKDETRQSSDTLVQKMSALIDRKLAEFRKELFPGRAIRPPLGKQTKDTTNSNNCENTEEVISPIESAIPPTSLSAHSQEKEGQQSENSSWVTVVSRKAKKAASIAKKSTTALPVSTAPQVNKKAEKSLSAPRSAVVTLTVAEGSEIGYGAVMATAKERVKLADCGITQVRQKRALTGGLILQIPGPDSAQKADALADRLRVALGDMNVKIGRPVKMGEIRVMDLDESISKKDIAEAIAGAGECREEEIKVGEIRLSPAKLGTVWVRCPLTVIHKLNNAKHVQIGWIRARIQTLAARQLQCYRCLEAGHIRHQCQNSVDRSSLCYFCGDKDHKARECKAKIPKCPVCADSGRPADHRLGSEKCKPSRARDMLQAGSGQTRANTLASVSPQEAEMSQQREETMEIQNSQS